MLPRANEPSVSLEELLARVGAGDEEALTVVYGATASRVFGLVCTILGDRQAAEEVTTEVYTRVWEAAGTYRTSRGSALGWLLTMARNRAVDRCRRRDAQVPRRELSELTAELCCHEPGPSDRSHGAERAALVRNAMAQLPRGQREAIAAVYFGGLPHSQVAGQLELPLGTVKTRIRSGMAALRRRLSRGAEDM